MHEVFSSVERLKQRNHNEKHEFLFTTNLRETPTCFASVQQCWKMGEHREVATILEENQNCSSRWSLLGQTLIKKEKTKNHRNITPKIIHNTAQGIKTQEKTEKRKRPPAPLAVLHWYVLPSCKALLTERRLNSFLYLFHTFITLYPVNHYMYTYR